MLRSMLSKRSLWVIRGLVALQARLCPICSILGRRVKMLTVAFPSLEACVFTNRKLAAVCFFYSRRSILTDSVPPPSSLWPPRNQVMCAGGLDPVLRHTISDSRPTTKGSTLFTILTVTGATENAIGYLLVLLLQCCLLVTKYPNLTDALESLEAAMFSESTWPSRVSSFYYLQSKVELYRECIEHLFFFVLHCS